MHLSQRLLDYYMREKHLEVILREAVEFALLFGEGFVISEWDETSGEVYGVNPDTQADVYEGDLHYMTRAPMDVIRDVYATSTDEIQWYVIRRPRNKFDLASKYPELADKITSYSTTNKMNQNFTVNTATQLAQSDTVTHFTFYHKRTAAMPNGRRIEFLDTDLILTDGPMPYRDLPVHRIVPAELIGTSFGYTVMYDLMPIQETLNGLYSTIKTNQETFGVQNILVPKGSGIGITEVSGGLNFIEYDKQLGKPEALNFTHTPPEVFSFIAGLEKMMETISGVNSVARGDPQASLKSGAALALVQSQAIQFSQGLQASYTSLLETVGQSTINLLRDFAAVPRIAMIVGKNNRGEMREFTGKDLENVNRVVVDQGNPMTRTTAGKVELAQMMIQMKLIDTPEQLLQVIQTGSLEVLTESKTNELLAIKAENEAMSSGEEVQVMTTDDHLTHIHEHKCLLSDPQSRKDPQIVQIVTGHLMEHLKILQDPSLAALLTLLGQQPVPQTPGPNAQPGTGGGAAPMGGISQPPMSANDMAAAHMPKQPTMPTNPLTHERYVAPQGTRPAPIAIPRPGV